MLTEDIQNTAPISAMHSFKGGFAHGATMPLIDREVQGGQALASSLQQVQGYEFAECAAMQSFQGYVHGAQALASFQHLEQEDGFSYSAAMQAAIHSSEGNVQEGQALASFQQQEQDDGFATGAAMHLLEGNVQGGHQAVDQIFVDMMEAPASVNLEANNLDVNPNVAVPAGPQGRSSLQTKNNVERKSGIGRPRHSQEDLVTMRNHFKNSSRNPKFPELLELSYDTNLDFKQIGDFFTNEREREKKRKRESGDTEIIISTNKKRHLISQTTILKAWVAKNEPNNPYPTTKQRKGLALETGLSLEQVSGWFMNLRKNMKKAALIIEEAER